MSHIAIRRYGAIELKMAYQRNMALAMLLVISFTALIIGLIYLLAGAPPPVVEIPVDNIIEIKAGFEPLPNIVKPKPRVDASAARTEPPVVSSNLIPIDDDEFVDVNGGMLPTRDDLYELVDRGRMGEGEFGENVVVVDDGDVYDTRVPEFTPCEIPPDIITMAKPEYPRQARMVGISATVWVRILVDEKGNAADAAIYVSSGSNAGFDEAALAAAMKCKFKPGIQNGRAVKVWVSLKFEFDIND